MCACVRGVDTCAWCGYAVCVRGVGVCVGVRCVCVWRQYIKIRDGYVCVYNAYLAATFAALHTVSNPLSEPPMISPLGSSVM